MYFGLEETFGFTKPLKEGNITYKVNDMEVTKKSLYVPGVGWCPMTDNLCKDFKNDPTWMALYCNEDRSNSSSFNIVIGELKSKTVGGIRWDDSGIHPCERLDIYVHCKGESNEIVFLYNSIRNEERCVLLPKRQSTLGNKNIVYEYHIRLKDECIYATADMVDYVEKNGFDNIRIDFSTDLPRLIFTPKGKELNYCQYDELLISLNEFHVKKLHYQGKKPYYFLEEEEWRRMNNHHLIIPNEVIKEPNLLHDNKRKRFDGPIEAEIESLVEFFKNKHFRYSSQVSNYIRENKLGYKYPRISGYLTFSDGCEEWEFEGGILPEYYKEIIERLNLADNGSNAHVIGSESYADRDFD